MEPKPKHLGAQYAAIDKMIALEHESLGWGQQVKALKTPVLIIAGDADVMPFRSRSDPSTRSRAWSVGYPFMLATS